MRQGRATNRNAPLPACVARLGYAYHTFSTAGARNEYSTRSERPIQGQDILEFPLVTGSKFALDPM
jgi:hypothetical protein